MIDEGVEVTSSLTQTDGIIIALIILSVLIIFGIIWALVILSNLSDEKKKYYQNLNKKLKSNE